VGKVIPFPEYENLVADLPAGVMAEIRRVCFHDRKRIAAFVVAAIEEKLRGPTNSTRA